jgi:hypothetical protein
MPLIGSLSKPGPIAAATEGWSDPPENGEEEASTRRPVGHP